MPQILSLERISKRFGAVVVANEIDLALEQGEALGIIGPNGAGKTTLFGIMTGTVPPDAGRVLFDGRDIARAAPEQRCRLGLARSFQIPQPFGGMTVFENLQMGASIDGFAHFAEDLERMFVMFPRLKERAPQRGGTLSGGEQQMLAIARALMSRPRLLLLDEPSLGLAPLIVKQIFNVIAELNKKERLTVFLVEQNAFHALKLAHRGYVMVNGKITMQGSGAELLARPEVRAAYLEGGH